MITTRAPIRLLGFTTLVALGACKTNAPSPAVRPEPSAPASASASASALAAKQAPGACEAIDAHNEGAIAAGAKELDNAVKTGAIPSAWTVDRPPIEAPCFETAAGAWAKKITRVRHGGVTEAFWSLVHIGKDGRETSLEGSGDSPFYDVCCSPTRAVKRVMLFDFDGDGDPEIGFDVEAEGPEGDTSLYHHLYTFRDGAIKPYPVPFTGRLEDIDKDGRPDLIREHNEVVKTMCDAYEPVSGPAVIAHALPNGTFSTTDKVAADHAKKVCPKKPERIVVRKGRVVDEASTDKNALCARLWGATADEIKAAIARDCHALDPRSACANAPPPRPELNECRHRDVVIAWAEALPAVLGAAGK